MYCWFFFSIHRTFCRYISNLGNFLYNILGFIAFYFNFWRYLLLLYSCLCKVFFFLMITSHFLSLHFHLFIYLLNSNLEINSLSLPFLLHFSSFFSPYLSLLNIFFFFFHSFIIHVYLFLFFSSLFYYFSLISHFFILFIHSHQFFTLLFLTYLSLFFKSFFT